MIALTYFAKGSTMSAIVKFILLAALIISAVLGAAWLGTAFFAAIGLAAAKTALISGIMAVLAKLPAMLEVL